MMADQLSVTIWNEYRHERRNPNVQAVYPEGIHHAVAGGFVGPDFQVRTATLDEPEHGLSQDVLDSTDVLIWWGHQAHKDVADEIVERAHKRVLDGMGLVVLHSGHFSKLFTRLMGTTCNLKWRESHDRERLWVVAPGHPIAEGLGEYIELDREEMYGEHFDVPPPETLVFLSWFTGGEVFRSGCCYTRGMGKIFYFRPGHETVPTYYNPQIQQVIRNAARWARPTQATARRFGNTPPVERS